MSAFDRAGLTDTRMTIDLEILRPEANPGYLQAPLPTSRDGEIIALLSQVIAEDRVAEFAHQLLEQQGLVLRVFGERMASAAVRNKDPALLKTAAIGFLLDVSYSDVRDVLIVLPLFCDAIKRLKLNAKSFCKSVRAITGEQLASPLEKFLKRKEQDKSLEAMGYIASADADGFRYVRTW